MRDSWPIRKTRPEETEEVLAVRNTAYPTAPLSRSYWDWRYGGNPDSDVAILVAEHEGNIIGLQPLASFAVQVGGQLGRACMLTGVVTHPSFQRRGVFTDLITQSVEEARERGDWLVYTFPNQYSHPGFMKAEGWIHVGSLPLYLKPLDLGAILEKRMTNRWLRGVLVAVGSFGVRLLERVRFLPSGDLVINQVDGWDERMDELWAQVSPHHCIIMQRDRAYLTWRYAEHPEEKYTILQAEKKGAVLGYVVVKTTELFGLKSGLIVDILALSPQVSDYLIAQALAYFREAEMEVAGTLITDTLFYPRSLRRNGFLRCPIRLCPKEFYFVCQIIAPQAADAASFKNWFLTWGDTDNV